MSMVLISSNPTCRLKLLSRLLLTGLSLSTLALSLEPAEARTRRTAVSRAEAAPSRSKPAAAAPAPAARLAVVSLGEQKITVYGSDGVVARSAVSTGRSGYATPAGIYAVLQKNRWHHSNIYSGAPMPYMQRITWSGIALHAGVVPGYPASHGCIRLPYSFAPELWGMTKVGLRVVVAPRDTPAEPISHAKLPVPRMVAAFEVPQPRAPEKREAAGDPAAPEPARVVTATVASNEPTAGAASVTQDDASRMLNPIERAQRLKVVAAEAATAAARAAKSALENSQQRSAAANKASDDLRAAQAGMSSAESRIASLEREAEKARRPEAAEKIKVAIAELRARREELAAALPKLKVAEEEASPAAFEAARLAREAAAAEVKAQEAAKDAARRAESISVLVSRKEGKVYVRQGLLPVVDAPVTIKSPELPLGTHLFLATEAETAGNLRWLAVSMPAMAPKEESTGRSSSRKRDRKGEEARVSPATAQPAHKETAAGALDRIELPQEVASLIADRAWAGAAIIVTDHAMSNETGQHTDFIVQPR